MNTLFASYNLPFLFALLACLLTAALQVFGGGDNDGHDADADIDADAHVDADADIDADAHVDADAAAHSGGFLSFLGVGQAPLLLIITAFLGCFGSFGLVTNALLIGLPTGYPSWGLGLALLAAVLIGLLLTRQIARLVARVAPRSSTAIQFEQLVGRAGVVVSPTVSQSYGRVAVRDSYGTVHTVFAVIEAGEPIPDQAEVALTRYDSTQRRFVVRLLRQP